ncbi:MAG: hypothetical protein LWW93_10815 [Hyphomicrobiales bacterium]|nr:hypothetical protein [Hyphomicrobiales bacterium]
MDLLNREIGTNLDRRGSALESYWPPAMEKAELRDLLDGITVVARNVGYNLDNFITEVRRIFSEEKVRYSIDKLGGVHLSVDSEFEQAKISAIRNLNSSRYQNVKFHFEAAYTYLDGIPPDLKAAIRNIFFANEGLFRIIFPESQQLSGAELKKHLKPRLDQFYNGQDPAIHVAQKQLAQFSAWIDGAHFYRHEPGTEKLAQPPFEMTIHFVAAGAAWLRWLSTFDNASQRTL